MYSRHKSYIVREIIQEKREWCERFDNVPYEYWNSKWKYLCNKLNNYQDMERQMRHKNYHIRKNK